MDHSTIRGAVLRNSLFATLNLLAISAVNLADTYFVSKLGAAATAAGGVVFAVQAVIMAIGYTLGMGGGAHLSRSLGAGDEATARRYATKALLLAILIGGAVTLLGLYFSDPLLRTLGATDTVLPLARQYLRLLLFATIPICVALVESMLLRAAGNAALAMIGFTVGGIVTVSLMPVYLFYLDLGIEGAGWAILSGYLVSATLLFFFTLTKHSRVHLTLSLGGEERQETVTILTTGLPSLFRHGLAALSTLLINRLAGADGDNAIAAMTVVAKITLLSLSFCTGIGQGMIPVAGYHFGARAYDKAEKAYRFARRLSGLVMLGISIPIFAFAETWIGLFSENAEILQIGSLALRLQASVLFLHGTITTTTMLTQLTGRTVSSTILAAARQGLFFLPILLLLSARFGIWGIAAAQPLSDLCTYLLTLPFARNASRPKKKEEPKKSALPS